MAYFERMCEMTGYLPKTTFWVDFSIADMFGQNSIRETFQRVFDEWKSNYVYLTELTMVLNWKCWFWYGMKETYAEAYCELYTELY